MNAEMLRSLLVDQIKGLMERDQAFLEWGILEIESRQTEDEQATKATKHQNGRGWSYDDASYGGYLASYISSSRRPAGWRLSGDFVRKARNFMGKYAGQLLRMAAEYVPVRVAA